MTRFRRINVSMFALAVCIMAGVMAFAFGRVQRTISSDYARHYALSSAEALSAHINKEISLLAKAARSAAVTDWMRDENDAVKKASAYEEMAGIVGELYGGPKTWFISGP